MRLKNKNATNIIIIIIIYNSYRTLDNCKINIKKGGMVLGQTGTRQRQKAYLRLIESDLRTYHEMKRQIEEYEREIKDMAKPSATDIRENIFTKSKNMSFRGGFNTSVVIGNTVRNTNDPTVDKVCEIISFRNSIGYKEMVRHIEAIDYVLNIYMERMAIGDTEAHLKMKLVEEKYFKNLLTDTRIYTSLDISRATFYRWKEDILSQIAEQLGYIF